MGISSDKQMKFHIRKDLNITKKGKLEERNWISFKSSTKQRYKAKLR